MWPHFLANRVASLERDYCTILLLTPSSNGSHPYPWCRCLHGSPRHLGHKDYKGPFIGQVAKPCFSIPMITWSWVCVHCAPSFQCTHCLGKTCTCTLIVFQFSTVHSALNDEQTIEKATLQEFPLE